jgi:hypothetical protein
MHFLTTTVDARKPLPLKTVADSFTTMTAYNFPNNIQALDCQVFPSALERDASVFFHGTSEEAFRAILAGGFRPTKQLASISFVKESPLALRYACEARSSMSPNGVVIAARFQSTDTPGIRVENSILYLYDMSKQPSIVGYCIIPASYRFI